MKCNKDEILIQGSDFECVVDAPQICSTDVMCKYSREAQETLLPPLVGWGLIDELLKNPDKHTELLCGSTFEYCGKTQKHFGLKRVLVYYTYGLYVLRGSVSSQPYGVVQKLVADSIPFNVKDLQQIKKENFQLASDYWVGVEMYLCANKDKYKEFNLDIDCSCGDCGCSSDKNNTHKEIGGARIRKVKTLRRY